MAVKKKFGQILLEAGVINQAMLEKALAKQEIWDDKIGQIMMALGYFDEKILIATLSCQHSIPIVDLDYKTVTSRALKALPESIILKHKVLPIELTPTKLRLAYCENSDMSILSDLSVTVGYTIEKQLVTTQQLTNKLQYYFGVPKVYTKKRKISKKRAKNIKNIIKRRISDIFPGLEKRSTLINAFLGKPKTPKEIELRIGELAEDIIIDKNWLKVESEKSIRDRRLITILKKSRDLFTILDKKGVYSYKK
ncbi:MAG: hypothetical protein ABIA04_11995 [Pseudomonadota bacterium]